MFLMALFACEESLSPCEEAAQAEPTVEVGVGEVDFELLADGDEIFRTMGPQGGAHVWGAVRTEGFVTGFDALLGYRDEGPEARFEVEVDGDVVAEGGAFRPLNGDVWSATLVGEPVYVYGWPRWEDSESEEVLGVFSVSIDDVCGTSGFAEREVMLSAI